MKICSIVAATQKQIVYSTGIDNVQIQSFPVPKDDWVKKTIAVLSQGG